MLSQLESLSPRFVRSMTKMTLGQVQTIEAQGDSQLINITLILIERMIQKKIHLDHINKNSVLFQRRFRRGQGLHAEDGRLGHANNIPFSDGPITRAIEV